MDAPLIKGEAPNLYDVLNSKKSSYPDKELLYESLKTDIKRVLKTLKPNEAYIIEMNFGIGNTSSKSLEEIGKTLHLSRERVRQIREKSIRRLKSLSRSEILKNYFPNIKIKTPTTFKEIDKIYNNCSEVVGMRYHSLVLADIYNIKFKGVSYDDKVKDICLRKNMPFECLKLI